jgi:hypothetical protein
MSKRLFVAFLVAVSCCIGAAAFAQTGPSPGPTNPVPPNPQAKPGATIVVNPTTDECRSGWNASLRWTKEQFDDFCNKLGASK